MDGGSLLTTHRWGLQNVSPVDETARHLAAQRLDELTKPKGSLGALESVLIQLAGIQRRTVPALSRPHFLVFAADHGVTKHHRVSRYESHVTEEMTVNVAMGSSVASALARSMQIPIDVYDVGVARPVRHPNVRVHKVAEGTADFTLGPAMTEAQLDTALQIGMEAAREAIRQGADALFLGELGIGNTTSASALAAWLLDVPVSRVVGIGTGVHSDALTTKRRVVEEAVNACREWLDKAGITSLEERVAAAFAYLGGFELAAMAGAMTAAAALQVPVILDGLLAGVSALFAVRLNPPVSAYLLAGHLSPEPAHGLVLEALEKTPILSLEMRVGEGSGALFAWPLIQGACTVMAETATFADARVSNPHANDAIASQEDVDASTLSSAPVANDFTDSERAAVYKVISARRDIRVFLPNPLPEDVVARILAAGHHGPSVGYMQPWNFILIDEKQVLRQIQTVAERERIRAGEHYPNEQRDYYLRLKLEGLVEAPLTICVTNDPSRGGPHVLGRNTIPETDLMSTSCAIENMWLAARAEGVGMGWVSIYEKADIRDILHIPAPVDPVALLTLGYTPHFPEIPLLERVGWGKRIDLDTLLYHNGWGELYRE